MKVLVIEDEQTLLHTISDFLIRENYICELAGDFREAAERISMYAYDIILLDITLPGGNGLDLLDLVQKFQENAGVIIISAKNSLDDKISGLDLGADDYMTKPFQLPELNARIKAVLRRKQFDGTSVITFNELSVDTIGRSATVHQQEITLTPREFDLLLFFLANRNRVMTRETIAEHLWPDHIDMADSLDFVYTHMNNLRKKIKQAGGKDYIRTIYGTGYKFSEQ